MDTNHAANLITLTKNMKDLIKRTLTVNSDNLKKVINKYHDELSKLEKANAEC